MNLDRGQEKGAPKPAEGRHQNYGRQHICKRKGNQLQDPKAAAGQLEVLWKVRTDAGIDIYKTTIRFADRDFVSGPVRDESKRREQFRSRFREAFAIWQELYRRAVGA